MENSAILAEDKIQFQKEQDQILKTLLNYRFFYPWRNITSNKDTTYNLSHEANLEIYITNQCNQNCEYCYLVSHDELYPKDKLNPENILKNLRIFYDYITINNFNIFNVDFFSGEIWHTQFGLDVLNITLDYIKKGMHMENITIPSNGYFINNDEMLHKIQDIIEQYQLLGTRIQFSFSVDGKIVDNMIRPRNNKKEYNDDFYDRLFTFAKKNNYKFHPMVSSKNVKYWKENHLWWKQMLDFYEMNIFDIMTLEVRNPDWTDESINDLCEYIKFAMDDFIKTQCHGDITSFARSFSGIRLKDDDPKLSGYHIWVINQADNFLGCTVSNTLTVRLGDLAICPCHRQAYNKYLYGYFVVEDDKITDIRAVNPQMAVRILLGNLHTIAPVCSTCIFNKCCSHGCYGVQIETNSDPFFPVPNVCKMFKAKIHTLFQYYREKGVIDYFKTISPKEFNTEYVQFLLDLEQRELEAYKNEMG